MKVCCSSVGDDPEAHIAPLRLPLPHCRISRPANPLERVVVEEHSRSKTLPDFPDDGRRVRERLHAAPIRLPRAGAASPSRRSIAKARPTRRPVAAV